jgi:hypothetical protein
MCLHLVTVMECSAGLVFVAAVTSVEFVGLKVQAPVPAETPVKIKGEIN